VAESPRKPPEIGPRQAFVAVAVLCLFCLVIGFILGKTI
jgi:hypothetical protein